MKKVFRIGKYIEQMYRAGFWWMAFDAIVIFGWPKKCEGKTAKEIEELGYGFVDSWLVEEED